MTTALAALPAATADLDTQVVETARRALLDQADQAGLLAAEVQLIQPSPRARPACPAGWDIAVQDSRSLSRIRLVARCVDDSARVPPQDFLLRATLSAEVLVVVQAVATGQAVSEDAVQLQRRDISQTLDAISTLDTGLAARTSLRPARCCKSACWSRPCWCDGAMRSASSLIAMACGWKPRVKRWTAAPARA